MMKSRPLTPKSVKPVSGGRGIRASTLKAPKGNVGIPLSKPVIRSSVEIGGVMKKSSYSTYI
jgi:hypothetical protein